MLLPNPGTKSIESTPRYARSCAPILRCIARLAILTLAAANLAKAATVNITTYGASPSNSDNFTQITNAINAAVSGDTVLFPSGTYKISAALTFKAGVTFSGQAGAVLSVTTANTFCFGTTSSSNSNITLTGLTLQGGGIVINNTTQAQNFTMTGCTIQNITSTTFPESEGMYLNSSTLNLRIVGNTFQNINGDTGIITETTADTMSITDNYFNNVHECIHMSGTSYPNCTIARNTGVNTTRMGIETQGRGYTNFLVEDNHFSHWQAINVNSFGLSIVPIGSGMSETTQYNTLLGRPAPPSGSRYGYGLEVGQSNLVQNNFIEGDFCNGIVIGGADSTIQNNVLRGPVNSGLSEDAISINYEPGGDPNTTTITGNTQTNTASYLENPTALTAAIINGDQVKLTWVNNNSSQTGVEVQRHVPGGTYSVVATGLAGTTTTYTDTTAGPNSIYAYRIRAYDGSGNLTYSPAVLAVTGAASGTKYEVENLTVVAAIVGGVQTSGQPRLVSDSRFSNGEGDILDATEVGDYVTYLLPSLTAGNYDLRIGVKDFNPRGIWQNAIAAVNGAFVNHGPAVDEYNVDEVFTEVDLGALTLGSSGDKWFKFTVTGKNSASSGYGICFDYIKLVPQ
jgi:hypothetical protein